MNFNNCELSNFPEVAVLLASYNGAQYIDEQVRSIASQVNVRTRLFVADDCSQDDTLGILSMIGREYNNLDIVLYSNKSRLGSAALNFFSLILNSDVGECEFVAFSDQDDIWLPSKLERAVEVIGRKGVDCYASNLLAWRPESGERWLINKSTPQKEFDYLFQSASAGCTYVLSRSAFDHLRERLRTFAESADPSCSHDFLIYALLRADGFRWVIDSQSHILYRQHASNAFGAMPGIRGALSRLSLMRSGWYLRTVVWTISHVSRNEQAEAIYRKLVRFSFLDKVALSLCALKFRRKLSECLAIGLMFLFVDKRFLNYLEMQKDEE